MPRLSDMDLVGRDGELELYATADRETGILYDAIRDRQSQPQPLQVFFKWGNFEVVTNA